MEKLFPIKIYLKTQAEVKAVYRRAEELRKSVSMYGRDLMLQDVSMGHLVMQRVVTDLALPEPNPDAAIELYEEQEARRAKSEQFLIDDLISMVDESSNEEEA